MNEELAMLAGDSVSSVPGDFKIKSLAQMERDYIEMVIVFCDGNILRASELLNVSPSTIYRKKDRWEQGEQ